MGDEGYRKTTLLLGKQTVRNACGEGWVMIEDSVSLDMVSDLSARRPEQVAIVIHPASQKCLTEEEDTDWEDGRG